MSHLSATEFSGPGSGGVINQLLKDWELLVTVSFPATDLRLMRGRIICITVFP
jgi:hypothetical protein